MGDADDAECGHETIGVYLPMRFPEAQLSNGTAMHRRAKIECERQRLCTVHDPLQPFVQTYEYVSMYVRCAILLWHCRRAGDIVAVRNAVSDTVAQRAWHGFFYLFNRCRYQEIRGDSNVVEREKIYFV